MTPKICAQGGWLKLRALSAQLLLQQRRGRLSAATFVAFAELSGQRSGHGAWRYSRDALASKPLAWQRWDCPATAIAVVSIGVLVVPCNDISFNW